MSALTPASALPCDAQPVRADAPHRRAARLVLHRRDIRVIALAVAIVAMSIGDLSMTLTFLTHGGMIESNPIARAVMNHNSPALLTLWKSCSVGLAVGILLYARRHRSAEIAAWIGLLAMTCLMVHWIRYIDQTVYYTQLIAMAQHCPDLSALVGDDWVRIDTAAAR